MTTLFLLLLVFLHLFLAPYTKVEESFTIQAIHDIVNLGVGHETVLTSYDHVSFPGAVPRSFVGAVVLGGIGKVILVLSRTVGVDLAQPRDQLWLQTAVRGVLAIANVWAVHRVKVSADRVSRVGRRSRGLGFFFVVLLLTLFHFCYYASRTLPNFVALPLVNFALSKLLVGDFSGITWLAFTGVVFRAEVGLFAAIVALVASVGFGLCAPHVAGVMVAAGALFGLLTSAVIDSYFWGYWVVPEISLFLFNVVDGNAAHWGVEPWSAYFTKYLTQLFRPPIVLALLLPGLALDPADDGSRPESTTESRDAPAYVVLHPARNSVRILFVALVLFIAVMSFQPHKEWRFIVYTVPVFSLTAANGLASLRAKWSVSFSSKIFVVLTYATILIALVVSLFASYCSSFNYPGGDAITFVNDLTQNATEKTVVHMDVPTCMSGVTKFTELHHPLVVFDKTENKTELVESWPSFNYIVSTEDLDLPKLHTSSAFAGISILPLVLLFQYKKVSDVLADFAKDALELKFTAPLTLVSNMIIRHDYIYVYENTKQTEPVLDSEPPVPEVDLGEIASEVNEEIDSFELAMTVL